MSIFQVLIHPDPRLRLIAADVSSFDPPLKEIVNNMYETMYEYNGIGLAATQVNIQHRIVVMDIPQKTEEETEDLENTSIKLTLINPEIVNKSETMHEHEEGCLSIPGQYANVLRPESIDYRYQDTEGNTHTSSASGLLAVCIQHEIDHLNGVLFIDHISRLKRERIEKKLAKQLKANT